MKKLLGPLALSATLAVSGCQEENITPKQADQSARAIAEKFSEACGSIIENGTGESRGEIGIEGPRQIFTFSIEQPFSCQIMTLSREPQSGTLYPYEGTYPINSIKIDGDTTSFKNTALPNISFTRNDDGTCQVEKQKEDSPINSTTARLLGVVCGGAEQLATETLTNLQKQMVAKGKTAKQSEN